ncbi:hypothetical protein [Streptomyces adonidis]|uniref:Uncharacterized protein n=1 Tax=Streptomyces sp. NBC_00093 TaxID=2975649 RepID=A0AAU2A3M9_9ACTN
MPQTDSLGWCEIFQPPCPLDRATWPDDGRVGRITKGDYAGAYLLLAPEVDDLWGFYISDDPRIHKEDSLRADDYFALEEAVAHLLEEMGVEWVKESEDVRIEIEIFDIRSQWRKSRRRRDRMESLLNFLLRRRR